ncbi:hypothetical protein SUGI_0416630 [Cryptomeria japonica]|uniref:mediator of RNA polymerase II transcription subunit 12 isoform X2 n=1 Tax=Cryptomeria japonica TaxID=3369 RepID=UPI002408EC2B|nr:mediator of RNA polymerase II transcription subunit 12 isoform X2 [Cryptomeria japonica]GLJ22177.1 hypothetical protein SUGI_0416630 [Cryptomeria japonica]
MHRYSAASCGGGVGNSTLGGASARDTSRSDLSYSSSNIPLSSRRPVQLQPYKPKCDKEYLNSRLGPPEFYPPSSICPEETLTREAVQSGYKEAVDGIEEIKEITLSLVGSPFWSKHLINQYKESIRKRLRAINDARVQKRKAGQVYGVPLSGALLTKSGLFPDLRTCGEDFKRKWIEGLSQPHKRLRSLADHVPHGYRKKALFEALIKHKVPLLRATWFIKITYLNQVRPSEKALGKRVELWTKDFIDYLDSLLDESCQNVAVSGTYSRDQSPQLLLASGQHQGSDPSRTTNDAEEPTLHIKWCYMVQILHWHLAEGLLHRPKVIEWVLRHSQEKESLEVLELLLPIVFELIDSIELSQTYSRMFVDIAVHWLRRLCPSGMLPDSKDRPREAYSAMFLTELLQYLIIAIPDTFVALDCFPLPPVVCPPEAKRNSSFMPTITVEKAPFDGSIPEKMDKNRDTKKVITERQLPIVDLVSSIQKRANNLSKSVYPEIIHNNEGKAVHTLDKALISGDVRSAYHCIFEESFSAKSVPDEWLSGISPCIRSSLNFIEALQASEVYAVFFLFEWATCDFRHFRGPPYVDRKTTGKRDFSRIYMVVSVINMKLEALQKSVSNSGVGTSDASVLGVPNMPVDDGFSSRKRRGKVDILKNISENLQSKFYSQSIAPSSLFSTYRCLHDAVVAWLDQHEFQKGEAFKLLQFLLLELIRLGVFQPFAYVRQLIISGIMDKIETSADVERASWHRRILEHLPASSVFHAFEDITNESDPILSNVIRVYSNERHFALHGFLDKIGHLTKEGENLVISRKNILANSVASTLVGDSSNTFEKKRKLESVNGADLRGDMSEKGKLQQIDRLKHAISVLLHFPDSIMVLSGKSSSVKSSLVQGKLKRPLGLHSSRIGKGEGTPGCDECGRSKRQKISEEKGLLIKALAFNSTDDDETWWVRKEPKISDAIKVEQPMKPTKQVSRGRQKTVRKTQSLAQLASARIEGSQGASSSHVCDSKVNCPHHKPSLDRENSSRIKDGNKLHHAGDLHAIGRAMKRLRPTEKWSVAGWLNAVVKQLVEGREKVPVKPSQSSGQVRPSGSASTPSDERSAVRWQLTEDDIAVILYILDISMDLRSVVKFLLWVLLKIPISVTNVPAHGGRSIPVITWSREGDACDAGECFILSCLQRYENVLAAADLLPEAISVGVRRAAVVLTAIPGGRSVCPSLFYVRNLLKKYGVLPTVMAWEKKFKASADQRLVAELEALKTSENESAFGLVGGSSAANSEDCDDHLRQKLTGRLSRISPSVKETVQRRINDAIQHVFIKERDLLAPTKNSLTEKRDDGYQVALHNLVGLVEYFRQTGGGTPQGDASVVVAVVAAVVSNVGQATVNMLDSAASSAYPGSSSIKCARRVIQIHIHCLRLLKEAVGEHQNRILEMTLATEASCSIATAFAPGKAPRSQFQLSPETPDTSSTMTNEMLSNSTKGLLGRATRAAAAVAALVAGSIVHGITNLERMVAVLRIKEGLEVPQLLRNGRSSSNGISRAAGQGNSSKVDYYSTEVYLYWFRVLISNCKVVSDGLVAELLGEPNVLALARMQHMMPLSSVLPPIYSLFGMIVWRPHLSYMNAVSREDGQLQSSLTTAVDEAIRHEPIRDVCLRDTHAFYHHLVSDSSDSDVAAAIERQGLDVHSKLRVLAPLRGRLFLHALLDHQMPLSVLLQDEGSWIPSHGDLKRPAADEPLLVDQLVHVLDTLQPVSFHWQWVELRLLLNEQVLIEKILGQNISAVEAMRAFSSGVSNNPLSESEKTFTEIVLTRLLVRPDAAALYSEVVHHLGKPLEEYLILHVRWVLDASEVLLGRKSLKQLLESMANRSGFSTKTRQVHACSWSSPQCYVGTAEEKKKTEAASPEEGEVAEEALDSYQSQYFSIEKGIADLVLPCLARSSTETCTAFATDLLKQMSILEQHINTPTRNVGKSPSGAAAGAEGGGIKSHGSRKAFRGGSPSLGRRPTGVTETSPSSVAALHVSMWLRLQFLLPLLPQIYADRDTPVRNMRQALAPLLLRLLGSRVVQEPLDPCNIHMQKYLFPKKEFESYAEIAAVSAAGISGESLFDRFLSILHALLSSTWSSWLKPKGNTKPVREVPVFDPEITERMQAELDHMQLSSAARVRLQAAMPLLPPFPSPTICSVPPHLSASTITGAHTTTLNSSSFPSGILVPSQKVSVRMASAIGKCKSTLYQDPEVEIDPWTLLEDGTGAGVSGSNSGGCVSGDQANLKACNWLKGAVRVRRTDLTYVGAVDDDT